MLQFNITILAIFGIKKIIQNIDHLLKSVKIFTLLANHSIYIWLNYLKNVYLWFI